METLLLNSREAASALSVCERTLWSWTEQGKIPCFREGCVKRYYVDDLRRFIEARRTNIV